MEGTPARRSFLTGAALAAFAGAGAVAMPAPSSPDVVQGGAVVAAGAPDPDAELIRLGSELEAAWAGQDAAAGLLGPDEDLNAVLQSAADLVDRIERLPAHTLAGLLVKARAISWCNSGEEIEPDQFCPISGATDGRIAASIVRDLLRVPAHPPLT